MNAWYTEYPEYLRRLFGDVKMQKLSVDAGFSCPNRDGHIGRGGCLYCNNSSFTPSCCSSADSVGVQLAKGKAFFSKKYPRMRYLAYFQSYTSTYADIAHLERLYREALSVEAVDGLVIGTRPDCMPPQTLKMLSRINRTQGRVIVEYGAESMHDATLTLINRNHTAACLRDAVIRTADAGISCGVHLIMGLPGETERMMAESVGQVCRLPIDTIKLHQLQIIRDTALCRIYEAQQRGLPTAFPPLRLYTPQAYADLCARLTGLIPRRIAIERFTSQAPPGMLVAPAWGLKNHEFVHLLLRRLALQKY